MRKVELNKDFEEKGITVIIPAYNEELVIKNCINSSLAVDYSNYEILIVNDGSKDSTMNILKDYLDLEYTTKKRANKLDYKYIRGIYKSKLYENVYLIDKDNGGKADALNAGIDYSSNELVVTLDADSMLEKDSLRYMNQYFEDKDIVAAGGTVNVVQSVDVNGDNITYKFKGKNIIKHQMLHYIHGFYVKKSTQSLFNSMIVISGAFGIFKKDILFNVKGFRHTVGEDMDITLKIHKYIKENNLKKKLVYVPEAICYTECPENFKNFYNQRIRWQKAFIDCVVEYWGSLFKDLKSPLSAFMAFDGFLLGTMSVFFTLMMPIVLVLTKDGYMIAIVLILAAIIFDFLQNIEALIVCRKYGVKFSWSDYVKIIFFMVYERFTYKLVPLILNSVGTIRYFLDDDRWSYIERKGEVSIV
ncbi:glycosyltransferase family 2 protein [Clostridium cavendishii]|nr:glycosyltransferase family 2 protein [Clostridium cavendishii]